jgi:hypothetical protein
MSEMEQYLGIDPARIYIKYENAQQHEIGFNKTTFEEILKKNQEN